MSAGVRVWIAIGLAALVSAALLHLLVLLGVGAAWAAMVHLTLFGWISALIVGVSYHTLPVFLGRDLPTPWLIPAHAAVFAVGVALATAGITSGTPPLLLTGLALEATAGVLFACAVGLLLLRGRPRGRCPVRPPLPRIAEIDRAGIAATVAASLCLPLALGLLLAARGGRAGAGWVLAAEHLAALGWVMLMIVGVAVRTLPRFSGRAVRGLGWAYAQLACHTLALALVVPALGFGLDRLFAAGGLLMALAAGLLAWTISPTLVAVAAPSRATVAVRQEAAS